MGVKFDPSTKTWTVTYSKRHPTTNQPVSRRRIGVPTEARAKKMYDDLVAKVNDKIKRVVCPPWEDVLDQYFKHIAKTDLRLNTMYKREKTIRKHTLPAWQGKAIDDLKTQDIYDLIHKMVGSMAESHRKFIVKGLRGIFNFAVERGYINRNPTPLLKFKISEKIKNVLTEEQFFILLRKAQELDWEWYPIYAMALYTGMRNGELYALTWDKVSLEKRQILVNCSWTSRDGYKSTKSGDDRIVEIPRPLIPLLKDLKLQSAGIEFVLPRIRAWDKGDQAHILRLFLKSVGLPEIRFHDLRASWATLLLSKGVAPSKVMSMGGWKDMDTMMIYMRKAGIDIKDATSVLDDMQTHGIRTGKVIKMPLE